MNPLKLVIPPQFRLAIAAAPWVAIAALAMLVLWQRADVIGAGAALKAADTDKAVAQDAAAIAVASNKVLTDLVSKAAAADRRRARELQRITTTAEQERHANQQIPVDGCFDGRLPAAAIRLYRYPPADDVGGADRPTSAVGAGTQERP